MAIPAAAIASTGAMTAGTATFSTSPLHSTASGPCAAIVAPTMPPISACEDDDGSPSAQVDRFQATAPMRPANTVSSVTDPASTIPLVTVAATDSDRNAPTKFSVADIATA